MSCFIPHATLFATAPEYEGIHLDAFFSPVPSWACPQKRWYTPKTRKILAFHCWK